MSARASRPRFASPGSDYLEALGELAYAVSSLEWKLLGDLPKLSQHLPTGLTIESLSWRSTGGIAKVVRRALPDITHERPIGSSAREPGR